MRSESTSALGQPSDTKEIFAAGFSAVAAIDLPCCMPRYLPQRPREGTMKLATFIGRNDAPAIGVVDSARGAVLDLVAAARAGGRPADGAFTDMLALIEPGEDGLAEVRPLPAGLAHRGEQTRP